MGVRAADDFIVREPVLVHGAQQAQKIHVLFGKENVVYDTFEVISEKRKSLSLVHLKN